MRAGIILLFLATVWLCSCADVAVKSAWQDGVPRGQSFSRVLVVGVSPNYDLRCAFESDFASELKSNATQAIPSCDTMKANSRDTRGDAGYKATGIGTGYGFGEYGMPVTYAEFQTAPPITTVKSSFHVLTKLYETRGATLLYTLDTKTKPFEVESTQDSIIRITTPTADQLRRDGLIR